MKQIRRAFTLGVVVVWALSSMTWAQAPAVGTNSGAVAEGTNSTAFALASVFGDHMVIQQGMAVPVWGTARPGDKVTVQFAGQARTAVADAAGRWSLKLKSLRASDEPRTLSVRASGDGSERVLSDVLVGEVWLASGQSNMEWPLLNTTNAISAMDASADTSLRLLEIRKVKSDVPLTAVTGTWSACRSGTVSNFSAVAYYFGRDLRRARRVPVGLIMCAWGGTPAEAWTPPATMSNNPAFTNTLARYTKQVKEWDPAVMVKYEQERTKYRAAVEEAKKTGQEKPTRPKRPLDPTQWPGRPACLYNGMIAPLQPFAIRGVIWYQGEANEAFAAEYTGIFSAMIKSWRKGWGSNFPFLYVQIAPHEVMTPMIREAQLQALDRVENTAMVVITDFGEEKSIHPKTKEPVGERLALAARALAYGESIEYSGPMFDALKLKSGKAVLRFDHVGTGLVAKGGALKGFAVAGVDRVFKPADARIDGKRIVVSSAEVPVPVAVRYGWANVPDVNLFNAEGLPASPFRTDDWPLKDPVKNP